MPRSALGPIWKLRHLHFWGLAGAEAEPLRTWPSWEMSADSRQWNCPLVASPAHTGSAPWTPCCPLGRMLCSGPRGRPGLGCLHSLDLCLPPCTPTCAPQREGQPLELSWVLLSWDPERCLVQPCTGPSPGKTLRWVSRVACPRLGVGGVTRNHRPAGLYCHL